MPIAGRVSCRREIVPMGFRVQLIAVRDKEPGAIQRDYGVVPTGQREEIPESPVVGTKLPNGAYLLYINDRDKIVPDDQVFARLSTGASLIACYANETVMNSYACAWVNGVERWSVFHDAQQDIKHLETSGTSAGNAAHTRSTFRQARER